MIRSPGSRNFGPGVEMFNMSMYYGDLVATSFFRAAESVLEEIVDEIDETTCIYTRKNYHAVCVSGREGRKRLKASLNRGETIPLHATATGKVLLAHFSERDLVGYIEDEGLKRYRKNTIFREKKLRAELDKVRERGYAAEYEEFEEMINAVAVPLFLSKTVNSALVVVAPVTSLNENNIEEVAALLAARAGDIQALLTRA